MLLITVHLADVGEQAKHVTEHIIREGVGGLGLRERFKVLEHLAHILFDLGIFSILLESIRLIFIADSV